LVRKFEGCASFSEWSNKKSLSNSKNWPLSAGVDVFRQDNFSAEDVTFTHFQGCIEFRIRHPEPLDYLLETMFLVKILQTQSSNDGCWFFNEKLSDYQIYLRYYLDACRKAGFVRKHKISNRQNWFTIKTQNLASERPIHIIEPRAQLLDHTQQTNHAPSDNQEDWDNVVTINNTKNRKNKLKIYNYSTKTYRVFTYL